MRFEAQISECVLMDQQRTQMRLLETAAEVFAEHGLRGARVREICERANANIAAINYYFRDKDGLYDAVLRHAFFNLPKIDIAAMEAANEPPEMLLRDFVRSLLGQLVGTGRAGLYAKLIARELVDPTHAILGVIDEGIRPQVELAAKQVRRILGPGASQKLVWRCAGSILGQCLYYYFGQPVILGIGMEESLEPPVLDQIADHIVQFSLAGLAGLKRRKTGRMPKRPSPVARATK
jgi:AcrR family transcriptional regulator